MKEGMDQMDLDCAGNIDETEIEKDSDNADKEESEL